MNVNKQYWCDSQDMLDIAVRDAEPGDTISLAVGVFTLDTAKLRNGVKLRGTIRQAGEWQSVAHLTVFE